MALSNILLLGLFSIIEPLSPAKPIWEVALEIGASVPKEEWASVPTDGARNFHHYLYGAPKLEK